jgi:hypothetical protein
MFTLPFTAHTPTNRRFSDVNEEMLAKERCVVERLDFEYV